MYTIHFRDQESVWPKSLPIDKFLPVDRVYWYVAHPYSENINSQAWGWVSHINIFHFIN